MNSKKKEIEHYCNSLAWEHYVNHQKEFAAYVDQKFKDNPQFIESAKTAIRQSPEYQVLVDEMLANSNFSQLIYKAERIQQMENSEWFKGFVNSVVERYTNQELEGIIKDLRGQYELNLTLIVEKEKRAVAGMIDSEVSLYIEKNIQRLAPELRLGVERKLHKVTKDIEEALYADVEIGIKEAKAAGNDFKKSL